MPVLRTPWRGVAAAFALNGVLLGAWASRIPAVVERHGLSEATLGLLILAMGIGALVSFPFAGRFADALGAVRMTRWIAAVYLLSLVLVGIPSTWQRVVIGVFILLAAAFFTRRRKHR